MGRAGEISTRMWGWYKRAKNAGKNDETWTRLLDEAFAILRQYDKADYCLAKDMFLAFLNYIEQEEGVYKNVVRTMQETINQGRNGR